MALKSYPALSQPNGFSDELLGRSLAGLSGRRYRETWVTAAQAFGVSPSAVSGHLVESHHRPAQRVQGAAAGGLCSICCLPGYHSSRWPGFCGRLGH